MADIFKNLEETLKKKYETIRTDLRVDHAEGAEETFTIADAKGEQEARKEAAAILSGMFPSLTMISPVSSVVVEAVRENGNLEISMADSFAVIVHMPEELLQSLDVLVKKGDAVSKGAGLAVFTQDQLQHSAFYIVGAVEIASEEDETEKVIRVFGPFIPQAA